MARRKRKNSMLTIARQYVDLHMPELRDAALRLRPLDGPAGSPRYAVMAEACVAASCPYGVALTSAAAGKCPVRDCPLRNSVRLLLDRSGDVVQVTRSGVHWS